MTVTNTPQNPSRATVTIDPNDPFPGVTARPLNQPDFVNIKPKNPLIAFRWVNRSVGPKESTQRLDQMTFAGFVLATPADCANVQQSMIQGGHIVYGDLILMKIDRKIYEGALKYNFQRAVNRLHPKAQLQVGQQQLRKAVSDSGAQRVPGLSQKLQAFQPSEKEIADAEGKEDRLDLGVRPDPTV